MFIYNDLARQIEMGKVIKRGKLTVDELRPGEALKDTAYVLYTCDDGKIRGCGEEYVFDIIEDAYRAWQSHINDVLGKNVKLPALKDMLVKEFKCSLAENEYRIHPEAYAIFMEAF